jgi:hypothetical protein
MKEKLKALFDNKLTWATIGTVTGSLFGAEIANTVNALGVFVMAIL